MAVSLRPRRPRSPELPREAPVEPPRGLDYGTNPESPTYTDIGGASGMGAADAASDAGMSGAYGAEPFGGFASLRSGADLGPQGRAYGPITQGLADLTGFSPRTASGFLGLGRAALGAVPFGSIASGLIGAIDTGGKVASNISTANALNTAAEGYRGEFGYPSTIPISNMSEGSIVDVPMPAGYGRSAVAGFPNPTSMTPMADATSRYAGYAGIIPGPIGALAGRASNVADIYGGTFAPSTEGASRGFGSMPADVALSVDPALAEAAARFGLTGEQVLALSRNNAPELTSGRRASLTQPEAGLRGGLEGGWMGSSNLDPRGFSSAMLNIANPFGTFGPFQGQADPRASSLNTGRGFGMGVDADADATTTGIDMSAIPTAVNEGLDAGVPAAPAPTADASDSGGHGLGAPGGPGGEGPPAADAGIGGTPAGSGEGGMFHRGGFVTGPNPMMRGEETPARLLEGEMVMSPGAVQMFGPMLAKMNRMGFMKLG